MYLPIGKLVKVIENRGLKKYNLAEKLNLILLTLNWFWKGMQEVKGDNFNG